MKLPKVSMKTSISTSKLSVPNLKSVTAPKIGTPRVSAARPRVNYNLTNKQGK